jgi:hypothetical protein
MVDCSNDHEQVGLPRAKTGQKRAEAIDVVRRHRKRHIFHGATSGRERIGEQGIFSRPAHGLVQARENHRFGEKLFLGGLPINNGISHFQILGKNGSIRASPSIEDYYYFPLQTNPGKPAGEKSGLSSTR